MKPALKPYEPPKKALVPSEVEEYIDKKVKDVIAELRHEIEQLKVEIAILKEGDNI